MTPMIKMIREAAVVEYAEFRVKWVPAWVVPPQLLQIFDGSLDFLKLFLFCPLSLQGVIRAPGHPFVRVYLS